MDGLDANLRRKYIIDDSIASTDMDSATPALPRLCRQNAETSPTDCGAAAASSAMSAAASLPGTSMQNPIDLTADHFAAWDEDFPLPEPAVRKRKRSQVDFWGQLTMDEVSDFLSRFDWVEVRDPQPDGSCLSRWEAIPRA